VEEVQKALQKLLPVQREGINARLGQLYEANKLWENKRDEPESEAAHHSDEGRANPHTSRTRRPYRMACRLLALRGVTPGLLRGVNS